jgi:hypothetical protein
MSLQQSCKKIIKHNIITINNHIITIIHINTINKKYQTDNKIMIAIKDLKILKTSFFGKK